MLIRGDKLTHMQRQEVLRTFVHRWTLENAKQTYGGRCPGCEQSTRNGLIVTGVDKPGICETPRKVWQREDWHAYHTALITDDQWLLEHAFHFVKDGSRLMANNHAEPAYMAKTDEIKPTTRGD